MERLKLSVRFLLLMLFLGCVISSLQASSGALKGFQKTIFDILYKVADLPFLGEHKVKVLDLIEKAEKQPNLKVGVIVSIIVVFFISNSLLVADLLPGSDRWDMDASIREVEALLNYKFKDKKLLEDALTHPSYKRLECLGDNAIALIVSSYVFLAYPDAGPREMSLIRSVNVSTEKLARVAVKHGFNKYLRHKADAAFDRLIRDFVVAVEKEEDGKELYGGMVKAPKVLADIVESIAAAIYVDCGMNVEKLWMSFRRLMEPFITLDLVQQQPQPVTSLFELCQKLGKQLEIKHKIKWDKTITRVFVDGILLASASSKPKEHAKLRAAKIALEKLLQKSVTMNDMDINEDENGKVGDRKRLKVSTDIMNDHKQSDEMGCSKKKLQELCDKKRWPRPNYRIKKQTGPPHDRRFVCLVQIEVVKDKIVMHGEEKSRVKDAESSAAFAMLQALQSSNYIRFRSCYVSEKIDQAT